MTLRKYLLDAAMGRVAASMTLRRPQHEALEEFHKLISYFAEDLGSMPLDQVADRLTDYRPAWTFESVPHMSFTLATGVGKSRLMAALIAYLSLSNQSRNFLILAPRRTVLDKFLRELNPTSKRYLFVDPALVPDVRIWHSDNISAFREESTYEGLYATQPVNIFLFSPQSLVGGDRKVATKDEFSGVSVRAWLEQTDDLVVLSDEAHHFGRLTSGESAAWTQAVRDLAPKLHLLFTATPRVDANPLYSYNLATCLRERRYTKDVRIITKERPKSSAVSDTDWDRITLEFALKRLRQKAAQVAAVPPEVFPRVNPVLLVCCADTEHADETAKWLLDSGHLTKEELLVAHSKRSKTEDDIMRLLSLDVPSNPVRVVLTVHQLTEGWDVSNVFVIAPLRTMGTFSGAVQTLGRGLRLPAGRRVDNFELDTLDILCFGRETLDEILSEATEQFGDVETAEQPVQVQDAEDPEFDRPVPTKRIELPLRETRSLSMPRVRIVQTEPDLDFEPAVAKTLVSSAAQEFSVVARVVKKADDAVRLPRETFVTMTVQQVVSALSYLSLPLHAGAVKTMVERFLEASAEDANAELISYDWRLAAEMLSRQIDSVYRKSATTTFKVVGSQSLRLDAQHVAVEDSWKAPRTFSGLVWDDRYVRAPISGWTNCTHKMAIFDTAGEFHVAKLLDQSDVEWWLRNDPAQVRVASPIGYYGPDFVVKRSGDGGYLMLELKRDTLWLPPESDARIKARTADAYCTEVSSAGEVPWEHWVVLDEDAKAAKSFDELKDLRVNGEPPR